jgi:predicted nucleic acid-binding Zn ribbon protein
VSRRAPRPLAQALAGLTATLEPPTTLARTQGVWQRAVGERVATAARPTGERNGVLTVTCSDAVWSAELEMMPELVQRLNAALGERAIVRVRCRTG